MRIIRAAQLQFDFPVLLSASQHPKDSDSPKYISEPRRTYCNCGENGGGLWGCIPGLWWVSLACLPRQGCVWWHCRQYDVISAIANNSLLTKTCWYYHESQGSQESQEWGSIWWGRRRDERRNKVEIGIAISIYLTIGYSENNCNNYCFKLPLIHLRIAKCRLSIPTRRDGYKYHERSS